MVPRITSKGRSFKGAGAYFLHDLGKAKTSERVAFTHTVNMLTDDPEKALKVMAWTAAHAQQLKEISGQKLTGRKAENPVYNYVLAWAPDQNPDQAHMTAFGLKSLEALGVAEHEALFVAHNDTDHKHLHVIVNRVHPATGIMAKMSKDQVQLSRLAQGYEEETGRVYCEARVANNRERDLGRWAKAEKVERLANTPDYQERRAARIDAQRQAAELALERMGAEDAKAKAARDMRADFDQAAARDDRQYRAREIERPAADEAKQARAAWADERAKEQEAARLARKEAARRSRLDQQRAERWVEYEAQRFQGLNDRHTAQREGLYDRQAGARQVFEERLAKRFAETEAGLASCIAATRTELETTGLRQLIDRATGKRAAAEAQLQSYQEGLAQVEAKKERERMAQAERQAGERAKLAQRHEAERLRVEERLRATKARQDAAFAAKEQERAMRLQEDQARREQQRQERSSQRAAEAQRQAVQSQVQQVDDARAQRTMASEFSGHAAWREKEQGHGYGR